VTKLLAGCRTIPAELFRLFGGEGPDWGGVLDESSSSGKLSSQPCSEHFS
jgi:hypothetical protein